VRGIRRAAPATALDRAHRITASGGFLDQPVSLQFGKRLADGRAADAELRRNARLADMGAMGALALGDLAGENLVEPFIKARRGAVRPVPA
jgi:hypothetical protein